MSIRSVVVSLLVLIGLAAVGFGVRHWVRFPPGLRVASAIATDVVPNTGDAADDPAIWVDDAHPERSLVVATDKKGGLVLYDLDGHQLQYLPDGRFNNVDLRDGFPFPDGPGVLVASSDNLHDRVAFYRLDPAKKTLTHLDGCDLPTEIDAEGIALHHDKDGGFHVFVVGDTNPGNDVYWLKQWRLGPGQDGVAGEAVRTTRIGTKSEGCVADDDAGFVYVSEEDVGIWRYRIDPTTGDERTLVCKVGFPAPLRHDVEGLAILGPPDSRVLIASSQGSDDFVVLRLTTEPPEYVGRFSVEGVSDTDGVDAVATPLGERFPGGMVAVHNGADDPQHYNFIPWQPIADGLDIGSR